MPGLVMEPNQASARPSRSTNGPSYNKVAAATQSVVKQEGDYASDDDHDVYRSRPQLQQPQVLMRSLGDLIKMMQAGTIDVDPEYQRDVVWTADRMTGLIDSLMENFYIPPIILNKKSRPNQDTSALQEVYVCVDGKQRLSTVLAFVKGVVPCHDHQGEKWWFCESEKSKRRRVLSEQQRRDFFQKDFVSSEYNDLSPEQEEDLFARVQMGVQLNLAEKMRASTGPWQELARLFVADFEPVYALMKDRARSKDFQLTLSCFSQIVECMHPTAANGVPMLKTNHTHLPKLLSNIDAVDDALKSHLASVWTTFKGLIDSDPNTFDNANKYLRGVQTFAPVEMVAVTVLISMHSESRNDRLLLGDIQAMRTAVRENFVDLRLNTHVWKWFWEYIDNLEVIRGAIDGTTVNRKTKQRTRTNDTMFGGGTGTGSTVAAITAAAAAPKKGRFTARTKRPADTPADETPVDNTPVTVKQELVPASMPGPRSTKRQRTHDNLPDGSPADGDLPWDSTRNTTAQPSGMPDTRTHSNLSPPIPTHASTQRPQPAARKLLQKDEPSQSASPGMASLPRLGSLLNDSVQPHVHPPTPSEARQQRVSALNSFQSTRQSSIESLPNGLPEFRHQPSVQPPRAPVAPMRDGVGVFSSSHSTWRGGDTQPSEAPGLSVVPQVYVPARPHSTQKARIAAPQPTEGQHDGPIDLTSDTEQERASLLSAFKTNPVSTKKVSKAAANPASQKDKTTARKPKLPSQELPTRDNNPYTRYKSK